MIKIIAKNAYDFQTKWRNKMEWLKNTLSIIKKKHISGKIQCTYSDVIFKLNTQ